MLQYSSYTKLNKLITSQNLTKCSLAWSRLQSTSQKTVIDEKLETTKTQIEHNLLAVNLNKNTDKPKNFAQLFKESKFVQLGNLENKYLIGRIADVVGDDLYIDYGGKFYCVCKRPTKNEG
jgi:hypothetical protein